MPENEVVAVQQQNGIPALTFTREQVELIKRTVAAGATDDELALFMYTAKRLGADPLAHQIHFVKRNTKNGPKASFQTSIDWYRLTADRTGKYAGNDDPAFDNEEKPMKATVTVYKIVGGEKCAFTATARWSQYYPGDTQGFMWNKMPHLMLGKCAEALALRKAFPAELAGVYINEEMQQADEAQATRPAQATPQEPRLKAQAGVDSEPGEEVAEFLVEKTTRRIVKTKDGEKTVYAVYADGGAKFETWLEDFARLAESVKGTDTPVKVVFTRNEWKPGQFNLRMKSLTILRATSPQEQEVSTAQEP